MYKIFTALALIGATSFALAQDNAIRQNLEKFGLTQIEVKSSPIKGLKTVVTEEGVLYVSDDGKYVLQGKLFELTEKGPIDVSAKALMQTLQSYQSEMIVYPAKNQKHIVNVFMDITCYYCHKFHQQIKQYNDLGITVRYLAFPRRGMDKTAQQMETIFTSPDKAHAMNEAEKGNLPQQLKTPNIVEKHYKLGVQFGVQGTPSIVTESGELIGGYLEPKALLAVLEAK